MEKIDTEKTKMDKLIRDFENTKYFGYMFFVEYEGQRFESFDENPNKKSVKSEFRKYLTLMKVDFSEKLEKISFFDVKNIEELINLKKNNNEIFEIENSEIKIDDLNEQLKSIGKVKKIERNSYFTVFFVEKKDKGEFIGKRGKNIRKLKRIFGDIVVKEI